MFSGTSQRAEPELGNACRRLTDHTQWNRRGAPDVLTCDTAVAISRSDRVYSNHNPGGRVETSTRTKDRTARRNCSRPGGVRAPHASASTPNVTVKPRVRRGGFTGHAVWGLAYAEVPYTHVWGELWSICHSDPHLYASFKDPG